MRLNLFRLALPALIAAAVGCAEERPPLNRVQDNAFKKSFFVGEDLKSAEDDPEFYMRGTVVDVGYGAGQDGLFTSTYAQPISRIRWDIQEGVLNARLAYERIQGTDTKGLKHDGLAKKRTNDGQIVASYRIQSHFDIAYAYNPGTGEKLNVLEENSYDRRWQDREFIRVDWSQNLVTSAYDFDTLSQIGLYGGVRYSPLAYTVLDPNDADAPHSDPETGYLDVTNKVWAEPQMIDLRSLGWGIDEYPACYLDGDFAGGTAPYGNCNPTELTIRQSFKRVVDTDYEPVEQDGIRFQILGAFLTEYRGYDRQYGMVDDKWFRFADRYNIWERSHYYADPATMTKPILCDTRSTTVEASGDPTANPNRDADENGTADECAKAGDGSQCDVFKGKCTLPYSKRKALTIPWYYTGGSTDQIRLLTEELGRTSDAAGKRELRAKIEDARQKGEDLFQATDWAVQEWDLAMKAAIRTSRLVECRRTGGASCDTAFPMWRGQQDDTDEGVAMTRILTECRRDNGWDSPACDDQARSAAAALAVERGKPGDDSTLAIGDVVAMPPVIVLCHNPVVAKDHPACGKVDTAPRLGDIRYNLVLGIDKPQQPSSWGIMVDADDPVTGEKVAASINIWTHVTDVATQQLVDLVRYMNGELATADITNGKYIQDWVKAQKNGAGIAGMGPTMSEQEVIDRLAAAGNIEREKMAEGHGSKPTEQVKQFLRLGKERVADVLGDANQASPGQAMVAARMRAARGTTAEATLINGPMLQLAGIKGNMPLDGPIAQRASPLAMNNPKVRSELRKMRENALGEHGACILAEAPEASSLTGIADVLKRKFPPAADETAIERESRYTRMVRYLRRRYHYAVIAHEMGHSIGLRHNFVSSAASLFFRPQYWQLRTKNGTVTNPCNRAVSQADAADCVGPRYYDPVTPEEQGQLISMFTQSTVMDYPGDVSQDLIGLGVYDFAAARFFYGDNVSVYDVRNGGALDPAYKDGGRVGAGITAATDTFGGLSGVSYGVQQADGSGVDDFHYSQLQANYKLISDCRSVTPVEPAGWREDVDGIWDQVMDGQIVSIDGVATKCRQLPVDYAGYSTLRSPDGARGRNANPSVDPQGRLRVPYSFATDHWADSGNVSVFRHDAGADPYEQVMFLISTQENRHIFDNYRRGRSTFSARAAADRSFDRYNQKLLGIAGGIGFYQSTYQDLATNQGVSFSSLWPYIADGFAANLIAASIAFDHFTRELTRPQAGPHYYRDARFGDPVLHSDSDADDYGAGTDFSPAAKTGQNIVTIPNGSTGFLRDIGFGGHPLENGLADDKGDFSSEYMTNAGSYYDKINTAILFAESEDRFISQSRRDFYDARFRAVGMADVFPEGVRRVLANALTNDRYMLAPRLEATPAANQAGPTPILDANGDGSGDPDSRRYPSRPVGWVSWWPAAGPRVCFPKEGRNACSGVLGESFDPTTNIDAAHQAAIDPQIGWEVQKFLIAWTMAYIPANQKTMWQDMMRIWRLGSDSAPEVEQRLEFQDPQSGEIYAARSYGKECLFGPSTARAKGTCEAGGGKWIEKGIAARVLEYANSLVVGGYQLDTANYPASGERGPGFNRYGRAMVKYQPDGTPIVVPDPMIRDISPSGTNFTQVQPCDRNVAPNCTPVSIDRNRFARELTMYKSVPDYLREMGIRYGLFGTDHPRALYP